MNKRICKGIFAALCVCVIVAYVFLIILPHDHDCYDHDCIVCTTAENIRSIFGAVSAVEVIYLLVGRYKGISGIVRPSLFEDSSLVAKKVKLSS